MEKLLHTKVYRPERVRTVTDKTAVNRPDDRTPGDEQTEQEESYEKD